MNDDEYQWCSWCYNKTKHSLIKKNYLTRNEYQCDLCKNYTVQCRYCQNMAKHKPKLDKSNGFINNLQKNWASECCAEHDGSIADFAALSRELKDIEDYKNLLESDKWNLAKGGKIIGEIVAQTIISRLTYSQFRTFLSSETSTGLSALESIILSDNYFGDIKDFKISKIKKGEGSSMIFINGFLSQKNEDTSDWEKSISKKYANNPYYHVNWESSTLLKLGSSIVVHKPILGTLNNPWYRSMLKAEKTGNLLANIISKTENKEGYTLMGHSLGARVIYYFLESLGAKKEKYINDVYLLGGAVDRKDNEGWNNASKAVKGNIFNFYSENDQVLNILYKSANLGISANPIGLGNIEVSSKNIINKDVSHLVNGHMEYKENFGKILNEL